MAGHATGTTLSNIELMGDANQEASDAEIKGTGARVGGLVGDFSGSIIDVSSSLTVRGGADDDADNTGGLVGRLVSGLIQNSNSSGSVSASGGADSVGGLVGRIGSSSATISNSWASGNVSNNNGGDVNSSYGGLVGLNTGVISNSWASGAVSGSGTNNYNYGGLVGVNNRTIKQSWASGNVSGDSDVGGLVGQNNGNFSTTITNSWASGNVSGGDNVGGLVGSNAATINQNWASGNVSGGDNVGGLVGVNNVQNVIHGRINGRNYQLDAIQSVALVNDAGDGESFHLANTAALASLSGAGGINRATHSDWHAGFDTQDAGTEVDLDTRYCDTNGNGKIDDGTVAAENPNNEQVASNSVWVMPPMANDVAAPTTAEDGVTAQAYHAIPAIRCIGNSDSERQANIDRQRRNFPQ